jgi:alpha-glucosidase
MTDAAASKWWRGAVIYQIYPRSFFDANGDGLGDLKGIEQKLDYIASLGVDAIWLSPIFPSPQVDFGYDVSDYCDIEPTYGTLADFDRLLEGAHKRGLKLLLDQVLAHTSDRHPWFLESRASGDNPKADWYVWADPKDDGTVPNNWLATFGGPAWSYWPERRQYFHHKFYPQQPKLNFHNSDVVQAVLKSVEFWLERGVDGFRLDVANAYLHDAALADNPPIPPFERSDSAWRHPPNMQRHTQDANRPESGAFLEALRRLVDRYPERFAFGEIAEEREMIGEYIAPGRLQSIYAFNFLENAELTPSACEEAYREWSRWPGFYPSIAFSNHDFMRTVSRFAPGSPYEQPDPALAKLCLALLLSLRGTVLLYQGEELGLPEADIPLDRIQDPVGRLYYPLSKGRDGCRTPMPWKTAARNAGFTWGEPWLPVPAVHADLAVDAQEWDASSPLAFAREMARLRKTHPALRRGGITFRPSGSPDVLLFEREAEGERIACAFNFARSPSEIAWPEALGAALSPLPGTAHVDNGRLKLGPLSAWMTLAAASRH